MVTFTLENITIPTPAAFNADEPLKQTENLCYVILQILTVMKTNSAKLTSSGELAEAVRDFSASVLAIADIKDY